MAALPLSILTVITISSLASSSEIILQLEGNAFFSSRFLLADRKPFKNEKDIERYIRTILDRYSDAGFPFCTIRPEFSIVDGTTTRLILHINEGERVIVRDYVFKTDGKTETAPLRKIAHIPTKQYFSLHHINKTKKAILGTNVFSSISESLWEKNHEYYVFFELNEKSSDYIVAAGSFSEAQSFLSFDITSLNLFGTLRQFQFYYNTNLGDQSSRKSFKVSFTEPIMLNPVVFSTTLSILSADSTRLVEFNGTFTAPVNDYLNLTLSSGVEMTDYLTDTGSINHTNSLLGIGIQSEFQTTGYTISGNLSFDYLFRYYERLRIRFDGVIEIARFYLKPHHCFVISDSLEYFDYFRLGGATNLRGYMEDEFLSKHFFWANIEYKRLPIYPLFDIAWFERRYEYSYGIGIDARTNLANASIVFAWPRKAKWNDGKVHLSLARSF